MADQDPTSSSQPGAPGQRRQLYGRRRSHALRPGRAALMAALGETWAVSGVEEGRVDPAELFPGADDLWLEIGFGGGEHLAAEATANPRVGFIGCEHYIDGVAKLLSEVERRGLRNVRVHGHDARDLMDALPDGCLGRVYLLYPDPWPKTRHHKRRFMNPENLRVLARLMRPGAELRVASDIPDYIRHSLAQICPPGAPAEAWFRWTARGPADWRTPWAGWPSTRYEAKALREGRSPTYLILERR